MGKIEVNQWLTVFNNTNSLIKIILFLIIWAVIWLPIAIPLARFIQWQPTAPISVKQKLFLLISLYLIVPLMVWWTIKLEGVSLLEYGLTWNVNLFQSILFGFILSVSSILLIYTLESILGWLQWNIKNTSQILPLFLPLLAVSLFVSFIEELIFRGVFFHLLLENYSIWWTIIISSLIFALLHLIWERKNTLPQLPGLFIMGIVLAIALLVDNNSLGLPMGLHCGWILILSCLDTADLYFYTEKSPNWLAGEKGKPLASMAGIIVLLLTGILLFLLQNNIPYSRFPIPY